jgi:hypothetical protein
LTPTVLADEDEPVRLRSLSPLILAALLTASSLALQAQVKVVPQGDSVQVTIDGQPFTEFVLRGGEAMKPYLYPLRSASGKSVTRHFPMEKVEGEPADHPHQRGLWFGHEKVNGFDFWNNETSYKTANRGRIEMEKIDGTDGGENAGQIRATLHWLDPSGKPVLEEHRTMVFRRTSTLRIIDFDNTLTAPAKVVFGDAKDGVFGLRLAPALQETATGHGADAKIPPTGLITNAEGATHEKAVWGKPSNWVDYSGTLEGEKLGVAIFDSPANAHRARWHVRGYGLFAANPFGLAVFTGDKSQDGSVTLDPGAELRFRYRVIIHPGDAAEANIAGLWKEYAQEGK